ncbi:MAG: hypothetical protein KatS3mg031_2097 [Chitinophagales bacterium]|nr:MAG: hypothetical protein KatS3mg031_2097 [Chitinophagales bacterium]
METIHREELKKESSLTIQNRQILVWKHGAFSQCLIETPRHRNNTFEPQIIRKRYTLVADILEDTIIGPYGCPLRFRNIFNRTLGDFRPSN